MMNTSPSKITSARRAGLPDWVQSLRTDDRDRYLLALLAPAEYRDALMALYAFDHQLATIARSVREPLLGRIRLQWWRDALSAIAADTPPVATPLTSALADARARLRPAFAQMDTLITAREVAFDTPAGTGAADTIARAEAEGPPLALAGLAILGVDDPVAMTAGRLIGTADAIARRLSGIATPPEAARLEAEKRLMEARALKPQVSRAALPGLRGGILADLRLKALASTGPDAYPAANLSSHPLAPVFLMWAAARGRY